MGEMGIHERLGQMTGRIMTLEAKFQILESSIERRLGTLEDTCSTIANSVSGIERVILGKTKFFEGSWKMLCVVATVLTGLAGGVWAFYTFMVG